MRYWVTVKLPLKVLTNAMLYVDTSARVTSRFDLILSVDV